MRFIVFSICDYKLQQSLEYVTFARVHIAMKQSFQPKRRLPNHRARAQLKRNAVSEEMKELQLCYHHIRDQICSTSFFLQTNQHNKIKMVRWLEKLDLDIRELNWQKNRNNYAKILYLMAMCEIILEPFSSFPAEGELPQLRNYEINEIINGVERYVNEQTARQGLCVLCQIEKRQEMTLVHNCQTKSSFCQTQKSSLRKNSRKNNLTCSQQTVQLQLKKQFQEHLSLQSPKQNRKGKGSLDLQQNKENQCSNKFLTNKPSKSKLPQSSRVLQRQKIPPFNEQSQKLNEKQMEESVCVRSVRRSFYFTQKLAYNRQKTFNSQCDTSFMEKSSFTQQMHYKV